MGLRGDRVAESRMEFLRHAGTANDAAPLKMRTRSPAIPK